MINPFVRQIFFCFFLTNPVSEPVTRISRVKLKIRLPMSCCRWCSRFVLINSSTKVNDKVMLLSVRRLLYSAEHLTFSNCKHS